METKDKLAAIREACVEANPDIGSQSEYGIILERPIRLADVLLAINAKSISWSISSSGYFEEWAVDTVSDLFRLQANPLIRYNLRHDDLAAQSEECITFLYDVLKQE